MRENIAVGILVFVLIMLFAITFFVLGRGEYEPGGPEDATIKVETAISRVMA